MGASAQANICRAFVWSGKCPSGMCLVGEVSVGDVSGWGNVCRGRVRRGCVRDFRVNHNQLNGLIFS